jgi:hypothetical protein
MGRVLVGVVVEMMGRVVMVVVAMVATELGAGSSVESDVRSGWPVQATTIATIAQIIGRRMILTSKRSATEEERPQIERRGDAYLPPRNHRRSS